MFYIETKLFRFSPDVSILKQQCSDLVQLFPNRNKNISFWSRSLYMSICMFMYEHVDIHENVTYFVHVYVPIYVPASCSRLCSCRCRCT